MLAQAVLAQFQRPRHCNGGVLFLYHLIILFLNHQFHSALARRLHSAHLNLIV